MIWSPNVHMNKIKYMRSIRLTMRKRKSLLSSKRTIFTKKKVVYHKKEHPNILFSAILIAGDVPIYCATKHETYLHLMYSHEQR